MVFLNIKKAVLKKAAFNKAILKKAVRQSRYCFYNDNDDLIFSDEF